MKKSKLTIFRDDALAGEFTDILDDNGIRYEITERKIIIDASNPKNNEILCDIMERCEDYILR